MKKTTLMAILLALLAPMMSAWAGGSTTWYAQLNVNKVTSSDATGSGKVYVGEGAPSSSSTYDSVPTSSGKIKGSGGENDTSHKFTFNLAAQADYKSKFGGWFKDEAANTLHSANASATYPITCTTKDNENNPTTETVYAKFIPNPGEYTLTLNKPAGLKSYTITGPNGFPGAQYVNGGEPKVYNGEKYTITCTPDDYHLFQNKWNVDGAEKAGSSITLTISGNTSVTPVFVEKEKFTATCRPAAGGSYTAKTAFETKTINSSDASVVDYDTLSVTLTALEPNDGYEFYRWCITGSDGTTQYSSNTPYTTTKVKDNITISAEYISAEQTTEVANYTALVNALDNNSLIKVIIPNGMEITVAKGATLTVPTGKQLVVDGTIIVLGSVTITSGAQVVGNGSLAKHWKTISQAADVHVPFPLGTDGIAGTGNGVNTVDGTAGKYLVTSVKDGSATVSGSFTCKEEFFVAVENKASGETYYSKPSTSKPVGVLCTVAREKALNWIDGVSETVYTDCATLLTASATSAATKTHEVKDTNKLSVLLAAAGTVTYDGSSSSSSSALGFAVDLASTSMTLTTGKQWNSLKLVRFFNGSVTVKKKVMNTNFCVYNCSGTFDYLSGGDYYTAISFYDSQNVKVTWDDLKTTTPAGGQNYYGGGPYNATNAKFQATPTTKFNAVHWGTFAKGMAKDLAAFKGYLYNTNEVDAEQDSSQNYVVKAKVVDPNAGQVLINGEESTFANAIANAPANAKIVLQRNVEIPSDSTLTATGVQIDLNGWKLTGNNAIINNGDLEIIDVNGNGQIDVPVINNGTLLLSSAKYNGPITLNSGFCYFLAGTFNGGITVASSVEDAKSVAEVCGGTYATLTYAHGGQNKALVDLCENGYVKDNAIAPIPVSYVTNPSFASYNLSALDSTAGSLYTRNAARSGYTREEWIDLCKIKAASTMFSGFGVDCAIMVDRRVAANDLSVTKPFPASIEVEIAANNSYSALFQAMRLSGMATAPWTYGSILPGGAHDGNMSFALSNKEVQNGTLCRIDMRLATDYKNMSGPKDWSYTEYVTTATRKLVLGAGTSNKAMIRPATGAATFYATLGAAMSAAADGGTVMLANDCGDDLELKKAGTYTFDTMGFAASDEVSVADGLFVKSTASVDSSAKVLVADAKATTYVVAQKVAGVGEQFYDNLAEAVAAANGAVVTLYAATEETVTLTEEGQTFSLNKNGIAFDDAKVTTSVAGSSVKATTAEGVTTYSLVKDVVSSGDVNYPSIEAAVAATEGGTVAVTVIAADTETIALVAGKTLSVTVADGVTANVTVNPAEGAFIETSTDGATTTYVSKKITVEMKEPTATVAVTKIDNGTESEVTDTAEIAAAVAKMTANGDVPRTDNTDKLDVLDKITVTPTKIVMRRAGDSAPYQVVKATFDVTPNLNAGQSLAEGQKLKFRLPVHAAATQSKAIVYHGDARFGMYTVQTYNNEKFIEVESGEFSPYGYELLDAISYNDFVAALVAGNGSFDGQAAAYSSLQKDAKGRLLVVWSPQSGCRAIGTSNHQYAGCDHVTEATYETPNRVNSGCAQYQITASMVAGDISISNVSFVYDNVGDQADGSFWYDANGWNGTGASGLAGELQLENPGDITIANCSFDGVCLTPYHEGSTTTHGLTVTASDFLNNAKSGLRGINSKSVTVTGCTFTDCDKGVDFVSNTGRVDGDIVLTDNVFDNVTTPFKLRTMTQKVNVTGDNTVVRNSPSGATLFSYDTAGVDVAQYLSISGGTYDLDVTGYVAAGFISADNNNGTWTVEKFYIAQNVTTGVKYDTLAEAVAAVPTDGTATTIKMLADTTESVTVEAGMSVTLDLNGKAVTASDAAAIVNNGTLTITDTSVHADGIVQNTSALSKPAVQNSGTFTLAGGTLKTLKSGTSAPALLNDGGSAQLNGGRLDSGASAYYAIRASGGSVELKDNVTVANGKVSALTAATVQISGGYYYANTIGAGYLADGYVYSATTTDVNGTPYYTLVYDPAVVIVNADDSEGAGYSTVAKALAALGSDGGKIKLLKDVSATAKLTIADGQSVTLDLNGHTMTGSAAYVVEIDHGSLEITGEGTVIATKTGASNAAFFVKGSSDPAAANYSVLKIGEDVAVDAAEGCIWVYNGGKFGVVVEVAGDLVSHGSNMDAAIQVLGEERGWSENSATITIAETGSVVAEATRGIYSPDEVRWNIYGTVKGTPVAVLMRGGTMSVYDGATVEGASNAILLEEIYLEEHTPVAEISGGVFKATAVDGQAVYYTTDQENATGGFAISGGWFSTKPAEEYCAGDYIPEATKNIDGTIYYGVKQGAYVAQVVRNETVVGKYETLQAAFDAAAEGDTVTLLMDIVDFTGTARIDKSLTFDGANHKIVAAPVTTHRNIVQAWAGSVNMIKLETGDIAIKNIELDGGATHAYTFLVSADNSSVSLTTENIRLLNGGELAGDENGDVVEQGTGYGAAIHLNNGASITVKDGFYACTGGKTAGVFPFTGILVDENGGGVTFSLTQDSDANPTVDIGDDLLLVGMPMVIPYDQAQDILDAMGVPARFVPYTLTLSDGSDYAFTGASPLGWNDIIDYGKEIMEGATAIGYQGLDTATTPVEVGLLTDTVLPDTFVFEDANFTINGNGNAISGTIKYTDTAGALHDVTLGTETSVLTLDMTEVTRTIDLGTGVDVANVNVQLTEEQAQSGTPVFSWDASGAVPDHEGVTIQVAGTASDAGLVWDAEMGIAYLGPCEARLTGPTHGTPVYGTLAHMIELAADTGDTVTLLQDVAGVTGKLDIYKSLTLDGAGHVVTAAPVTDYPNFIEAYQGAPLLKLWQGDITLKNITLDGGETHRYTYLVSADNENVSLTTENVTLLHAGAQSLDAEGQPAQGVGYGAAIHLNNGASLTVKDGFYADTHGAPAEAGQTIARAAGIFPFTAILVDENGALVKFDLSADTDAAPTVGIGEDLLLVGIPLAVAPDDVQGLLDYMQVPPRFRPYTLTLGDGSAYAFTGASPLGWNDIIDYGKEIMDAASAIGFDGLDKTQTPVEVGLLADTILPDTFTFEDANFTVNGNGNALSGTIKITDTAGVMEDIVLGTDENPLVLDMTEVTELPVTLGTDVDVANVTVKLTEAQTASGTPVFEWDTEGAAPQHEQVAIQVPGGTDAELVWDEEIGLAYIGPCEARLTGPTHDMPIYTSLAAAVAAALEGDTITLLANVADAGAIAMTAGATFNGAGKTLSGTSYLAVNAAGGTVKNVKFDGIGPRNATVSPITATELAGALVVEGCTFANGVTGYKAETDVSVTAAAGASVKISGNTFTGKTEKNYVIVEGAAAYAAEITGNVFNAGGSSKRAFAVVNGGENVVASGNYVADGLYFGVSTNGVNGSELAYPQLASPSAATAEKALPLFIVKNSPDGYPAIKGYAALPDAFVGASSGETILMTADATLDAAAVAASKSLVLDGQGFTLAASSDWSMKGAKAAGQASAADGAVTLQNITLKYDAASDYAAARLGGNVTLGENVVIDASAVTTPNAVLATGIAVAAGATPEVKAGSAVQAGDTLISALTLGDGASIAVSGLPTGLFDAIADNALALRTQEAKVTVGETVTYYNTLQEALNAAATARTDATVDVLCDIDMTDRPWAAVYLDGYSGQARNITINGNDKTITGLGGALISGVWSNAGVTIKDLTLVGSKVESTGSYAGAFILSTDSCYSITLDNCHVEGATISSSNYAGGLIGYSSMGSGKVLTITNCSVKDSTISGNGSAGGVIGHALGGGNTTAAITGTTVTGNAISGEKAAKTGAVMGTVGAGTCELAATVDGNTLKTVSGDTLVADQILGRAAGGELDVTGGNYSGLATYADGTHGDSYGGKVVISGGTFQTQPSQDAIADGFVAELSQDVNGWWTVGGPFVAKIGNVGYATLAEAVAAAVDGDTVELLADIEIASKVQLDKEGTFVIDGAGHTISMAAGATFDGAGILIFGPAGVASGYDLAANVAAKKYTLKDVTVTGFNAEVIRCEGCSLTLDGCTFADNAITENLGRGTHVLRLSQSAVTVTGCTFSGNTASQIAYYEGDNGSVTPLVVTDSLFTGNTIGGSGVISIAASASEGTKIASNTFENNTISSSGNVAVVYVSGPAEVSGNLFSGNNIATSTAANKEGVVVLGSAAGGTSVTGNAFVGNTLGTTATNRATVWVNDKTDAYTFDVGANYWGDGNAPEVGTEKDVYRTGSGTMDMETYATAYAANAEGYGVGVTESAAAIAQIIRNDAVVGYYWTLQAAGDAALAGDRIEMIGDTVLTQPVKLTKNATLDLAGHLVTNRSTATASLPAILVDGAALTVTNSVETGVGAIAGGIGVAVTNNASLTVQAGTIRGIKSSQGAVSLCGESSSVTVTGGLVIGQRGIHATSKAVLPSITVDGGMVRASGTDYAIYCQASAATGNPVIVVNGGETVAPGGYGIGVQNGATVTINGGLVTGKTGGAYVSNAKSVLTMNGGVVKGGQNGIYSSKALVNLVDGSIVATNESDLSYGICNISGGKFVMSGGTVLGTGYSGIYNNGKAVKAEISGGSVSGGVFGICNFEDAVTNEVSGGSISGGKFGIGDRDGKAVVNKISGGSVSGGIYGIRATGEVAISGGEVFVSDSVTAATSAIFLYGATAEITGGVVSNGLPRVGGVAPYGVVVGVDAEPTGSLTLSGNGAVVCENGFGVYVNPGSSVAMSGGTIKSYYCGIINNGAITTGTSATITGGKIESSTTAIGQLGLGTTTISGTAEVKGGSSAVEVRAGTLNVADSATLTATYGNAYRVASGEGAQSGTTSAGAAVAVAQHSTGNPIAVNIAGGTFSGSTALGIANPLGRTEDNVSVAISGGTFLATYDGAKAVTVDESETRVANFISGGFFSSEVELDNCADGYFPMLAADIPVTAPDGAPNTVSGAVVAQVLTDGEESTVTTNYCTTFPAAVAIADAAVVDGADKSKITVIGYNQSMTAPTGWAFVTDESVTTLQRAVAQVVSIDAGTGAVTTNEQFATIQDAIEAAGENGYGTTVEVIRNVTLAEGLEIAQSLTLTGAVNDDGTPKYTVTGPAGLTSASSPVAGDIFVADDYGAVVVTISNLKLDGFGKDVASDGSASVVSFYAYEEGSALTVENVEFSNYSAFAVATVGSDGLLTVKDCAMEGAGGVLADGADAKVDGGTMTGVAEGVVAESGASVEIDGLAVSVATDGKSVVVDAHSKATIADGVFAGKMLAGGLDVSQQGKGADLSISGGVFENYVYEEYCAADHVAVDYAGDVAAYAGWYQVVSGSFVASVTHEGAVKYYTSLAKAVAAAASGDTVTLLADDRLDDEIVISRNITITGPVDESGNPLYTIYGNPRDNYNVDVFVKNASAAIDVTIQNVNLREFGNQVNSQAGNAALYISRSTHADTHVVVSNVTFGSFNGNAIIAPQGHIEVVDCVIDGQKDASSGKVLTGGIWTGDMWDDLPSSTVSVVRTTIRNTDSNISGTTAYAIDARPGATVTVTDCVIEDVRDGIAAVATQESGAGAVSVSVTGTTVEAARNALAISGNPGASQSTVPASLEVASGTFTGLVVIPDEMSDSGTISISGGLFDAPVPESFCAEGYIPQKGVAAIIDGVDYYTVKLGAYVARNTTTGQGYETLEEALAEVASAQDVTLLGDVAMADDVTLTPTGDIGLTLDGNALDPNGHTVTIPVGLEVIVDEQVTDLFVAPAKYVIEETEDAGLYTYTPVKIVAMIGETPYTTFDEAVDAWQDGDTIVVVDYDAETMDPLAPEDWKFVTDETVDPAVTTLVRKDYRVKIVETDAQFETLVDAVAAANDGQTVQILAAISGENVTVTKVVTITGADGEELPVLTDTAIVLAEGSNVSLLGLAFRGDSVVDGSAVSATLTMKNCDVNVTVDAKRHNLGRKAFLIADNNSTKLLLLDIEDNTFVVNSTADYWRAAIFSWVAFADGSVIKNNVFGSADNRFHWMAVKFMNIADGATLRLEGNVFYGDDGNDLDAVVFDPVNTSAFSATVMSVSNVIDAVQTGNTLYAYQIGKAGIHVWDYGTTVNGEPLAIPGFENAAGENAVYGVGVTFNADGKMTQGTFNRAFTADELAALVAEGLESLPNGDGTWSLGWVADIVYPIEGTAGVPVALAWATNNTDVVADGAIVTATDVPAIIEALGANGANGMAVWQSYVLGLDPADAASTLRLTAAPASDTSKVTISAVIDTTKFPHPAGTTVTFRLAERSGDGWTNVDGCTGSESPSFERPLDSVVGKVLRIFADIVTE